MKSGRKFHQSAPPVSNSLPSGESPLSVRQEAGGADTVRQSADRLASSGYLAAPIASCLYEALKSVREPFLECEYPNCECPRHGRCGNATSVSSHHNQTEAT